MKQLLKLAIVLIGTLTGNAALTLTYAGDNAKPVAGVKITQTESNETVTVYASNSNGKVTFNTTANTGKSLSETTFSAGVNTTMQALVVSVGDVGETWIQRGASVYGKEACDNLSRIRISDDGNTLSGYVKKDSRYWGHIVR